MPTGCLSSPPLVMDTWPPPNTETSARICLAQASTRDTTGLAAAQYAIRPLAVVRPCDASLQDDVAAALARRGFSSGTVSPRTDHASPDSVCRGIPRLGSARDLGTYPPQRPRPSLALMDGWHPYGRREQACCHESCLATFGRRQRPGLAICGVSPASYVAASARQMRIVWRLAPSPSIVFLPLGLGPLRPQSSIAHEDAPWIGLGGHEERSRCAGQLCAEQRGGLCHSRAPPR